MRLWCSRRVYAAHSMGLSCRAEVGRMRRLRRGCPDLDSLMAWTLSSATAGKDEIVLYNNKMSLTS